MSDPAVEAAQRAWDAMSPVDKNSRKVVDEASAREALRLVREWYENTDAPWTDILPLIYTAEELGR